MNLQISKAVLMAGILSLTLFSCSKEATGEVKSISESFESQDQDEATYPEAVTSYDEEVLAVEPGRFKVNADNAALTATFDRLFANGEDFIWSFPSATPASSTDANPGVVTFPTAGDYDVTLEVTIDGESFTHTETVTFE